MNAAGEAARPRALRNERQGAESWSAGRARRPHDWGKGPQREQESPPAPSQGGKLRKSTAARRDLGSGRKSTRDIALDSLSIKSGIRKVRLFLETSVPQMQGSLHVGRASKHSKHQGMTVTTGSSQRSTLRAWEQHVTWWCGCPHKRHKALGE